MKTYNGMDYLSRIAPFPLTFCSPGVQDSHQCPDRRDSRVVEAGKKFPCSALMEFFAFSHSGSEENLTKHPIRKHGKATMHLVFAHISVRWKCKMLRSNEISWVHPAFLHVFEFPVFGRLHGPTVDVAAQQLGSLAQTTSRTTTFSTTLDEIDRENDREMMVKWPSLWICATTYTQRLKARHWGLTYLPKWRDPLEQWALGWSGRGQRLCRKWIASTHINTFSNFSFFYLFLSVPWGWSEYNWAPSWLKL